jgi:hypothetical protein
MAAISMISQRVTGASLNRRVIDANVRRWRQQQATAAGEELVKRTGMIRPKRIYIPEHFCYCFSSNLCVLNTTNMD